MVKRRRRHALLQKSVEHILDRRGKTPRKTYKEMAFYSLQNRLVLRNCGRIDPEDIEEYIASGGYEGLAKALEMGPEKTLEEVKASGVAMSKKYSITLLHLHDGRLAGASRGSRETTSCLSFGVCSPAKFIHDCFCVWRIMIFSRSLNA